MTEKAFNFENTASNLLLLSPPVMEDRLLLTASSDQQDEFINMMTFTREALISIGMLPSDAELKICMNSFIEIDNKLTEGQTLYQRGTNYHKEAIFTSFDSLKHVGPLVENCLETYTEFLDNSVSYIERVPDSTQLLLNVVGNFAYITRHLARAEVSLATNAWDEAGSHVGNAFRYLFINFDINAEFEDLPGN